jgi:hypothetical protein
MAVKSIPQANTLPLVSRLFLDRPRWREAGFFRRLTPFPLTGMPVVASHAALNHFVAPPIARYDEGDEIAAAEAKGAEHNNNAELQ